MLKNPNMYIGIFKILIAAAAAASASGFIPASAEFNTFLITLYAAVSGGTQSLQNRNGHL